MKTSTGKKDKSAFLAKALGANKHVNLNTPPAHGPFGVLHLAGKRRKGVLNQAKDVDDRRIKIWLFDA